ncbi:permease [Jeotgalibacillus sp. R-1-5s-1]|uniref:permease n=1 Tax=Jeotgalibacillus sp. R-1-5s-1 TaxID=2555897 RepID=UPI00106949E7|nr:permease [Jeotgalibacillus sp. R-1-5s-1]TFE00798.1 permease [Jeotgalibacillus sp. R-1-5s-1]
MKDYNPKLFLIIGIVQVFFGLLFLAVALIAEQPPVPFTYLSFAIAVMCFSLSYLQPQFKQRDERMKMIRSKGMYFSFFISLGYINLFILLFELDLLMLEATTVLYILIALMLSTVFLSWVVLSKRY